MSTHKQCAMCERKVIVGELCHEHAESWARTQGLISQLALPPLQGKSGVSVPVEVEVEVEPGRYAAIKTMSVDAERIVITTADGAEIRRSMKEGAPPWRNR